MTADCRPIICCLWVFLKVLSFFLFFRRRHEIGSCCFIWTEGIQGLVRFSMDQHFSFFQMRIIKMSLTELICHRIILVDSSYCYLCPEALLQVLCKAQSLVGHIIIMDNILILLILFLVVASLCYH